MTVRTTARATALGVLIAATVWAGVPLVAQGTREDYARAERFLTPRVDSLVRNDRVRPHWINESDRFWYVRELPDGKEFALVDPAAGRRERAFDHERLAASLGTSLGEGVEARHLPFDRFAFTDDGEAIEFDLERTRWRCALTDYACATIARDDRPAGLSPDGRWVAFVRDYDLYVRSTETGREIRLTDDGHRERAYATPLPSPTLMRRHHTETPAQDPGVRWSPDSKRLVTYRIDARGAGTLSMVEHAPPDRVRPRHYTYYYPLPEDSVLPTADLLLFEVGVWRPVRVPIAPIPLQYYGGPRGARWLDDGRRLSAVLVDRGYTRRRVIEIDATTGTPRVVVEEQGEPYVDVYAGTVLHFAGDGAEVVWGSERDGWMHLYLYDAASGRIRRQLTRGEWVVRSIEHVDETARVVYFTAVGREPGRDPYLVHLYRVGLDGSGLRLLTPEAADHTVAFSPTGAFFVDSYSRPDIEPMSVLRRATDGATVMELERADVTPLRATGWKPPTPFQAVARDGVTDIYGLIWWPSTYDSTTTYPVVEQIYAGPHRFFVPKGFSAYRSPAQAIAELGFIVVQVDGLGTSGRGRAFHLWSYQNLGDGGVADHIAALRQMAARYPAMDLNRVGIYGHSAGGYDAAHALLTHPGFYKVAVSSAGNHDHRLDKAVWNTQWMGWPVGPHYEEQSNVTLAHRLEGKLLLVHGDVDENVPVSATLRFASALIEANKDFEMLIMPNQTHGFGRHPYFVRKRWDFFVEHLLGVDPPAGYVIASDEN